MGRGVGVLGGAWRRHLAEKKGLEGEAGPSVFPAHVLAWPVLQGGPSVSCRSRLSAGRDVSSPPWQPPSAPGEAIVSTCRALEIRWACSWHSRPRGLRSALREPMRSCGHSRGD